MSIDDFEMFVANGEITEYLKILVDRKDEEMKKLQEAIKELEVKRTGEIDTQLSFIEVQKGIVAQINEDILACIYKFMNLVVTNNKFTGINKGEIEEFRYSDMGKRLKEIYKQNKFIQDYGRITSTDYNGVKSMQDFRSIVERLLDDQDKLTRSPYELNITDEDKREMKSDLYEGLLKAAATVMVTAIITTMSSGYIQDANEIKQYEDNNGIVIENLDMDEVEWRLRSLIENFEMGDTLYYYVSDSGGDTNYNVLYVRGPNKNPQVAILKNPDERCIVDELMERKIELLEDAREAMKEEAVNRRDKDRDIE